MHWPGSAEYCTKKRSRKIKRDPSTKSSSVDKQATASPSSVAVSTGPPPAPPPPPSAVAPGAAPSPLMFRTASPAAAVGVQPYLLAMGASTFRCNESRTHASTAGTREHGISVVAYALWRCVVHPPASSTAAFTALSTLAHSKSVHTASSVHTAPDATASCNHATYVSMDRQNISTEY